MARFGKVCRACGSPDSSAAYREAHRSVLCAEHNLDRDRALIVALPVSYPNVPPVVSVETSRLIGERPLRPATESNLGRAWSF